MIEHQAQKEAIQAAKESFELQKSQMDYLLEVSNKIDAPELREQLKRRILQSADKLSLGDPDASDVRKMLPPG